MNKSIEEVRCELRKAQQKHPKFAASLQHGANLITEEYLELIRAINDEEPIERIKEEAAHLCVCGLRFLEMLP